MHKLAEDIGAGIAIPLIHIVDETGEKMRADGIKTAAVIGTRNVMTESWYRQRLVRYGLTLAPYDGTRAEEEIGRAHVELQSLMRISYAVFCLKNKNTNKLNQTNHT